MEQFNSQVVKRSALLTAAGITLQALGSICLFVATLGVVKEVNAQIKQAILQELTK